MVIAFVTLAFAQGLIDTEVIQMHHIRPSNMVKQLRSFYFPGDGTGWPVRQYDDEHGTLIIAGDSGQLRDAKSLISMFDVARRTVAVTLTVDSKIDFLHYQVSTKMPALEKWTTSDLDTLSNFEITTRPNDDDSLTIFCVYRHGEATKTQTIFRIMPHKSFDLGKELSQAMPNEKLPEITLEAHIED